MDKLVTKSLAAALVKRNSMNGLKTEKKKLKLDFADFWPGFQKRDNFFVHLLSQRYQLVFDEEPEILFFPSGGWTIADIDV